jgi:putative addiction module component (TIGR02574 family)
MGSERVRKVLALAEQLEPEERAELADELWNSLPVHLRGENDGADEEIARRLDEVHSGREDGIAWEEAHATIRAELASMPRR